MIDQVLGHYRIVQKIGSGGMGDVYRARDGRLGRDVAVKVLRPAAAGDPDRLRRFEQEARAAAALNHPNIVAIFDIGVHEGAPYIVSELLEGETLRQKLQSGPLSIRLAADYGRQIAAGLVDAHEKHIIHRDLKPENLFLTRDGHVKILDFGVAKLSSREAEGRDSQVGSMTTQTKVGTILGTVGYMSPEQLRGKPVDHRSDIFSLGAILYEMLSGSRAFHGETEVDTMMAVLNSTPRELTSARENLPVVFEQIIDRCVEKDPENRFQSARDLAFALSTIGASTASRQALVERTRWTKVRRYLPWMAGTVVLIGLALWLGKFLSPQDPLSYRRITFERGTVYSARFRPDGRSIIYGAAWNGQPLQVYSTVGDSPQAQPLELPGAYLFGISRDNELAIALRWIHTGHREVLNGVLARTPLAGGTPKEVQEDVRWADWSPDGRLAVVRSAAGHIRLEFPIGNVLYETTGSVSDIRFSLRGDRIAFMDHSFAFDDRGSVCVIDLAGKKSVLTRVWESESGLAWSADGNEIWFTAAPESFSNRALWAVDLAGRTRKILSMPAGFTLQDIASDGRVLITMDTERTAMEWVGGNGVPRDLSWYDWSIPRDITRDGQWVLFEDGGGPAGEDYAVAIRKADGSPPIRLGEGTVGGLSPDGKWALAILPGKADRISLLPVGTGQSREIPVPGVDRLQNGSARFMPDGKRVLVTGYRAGHSQQCYLVDLSGSVPPRPVAPEGSGAGLASPDGEYIAGIGLKGADGHSRITLFPVEGGTPRELSLTAPPYGVMQWSADSKALYLYRPGDVPLNVYRLDIATQKVTLVRDLAPADRGGLVFIGPAVTNYQASEFAYSYMQILSVMYVVTGLR
jgi:serine/threonine protein kinase/dipeptidyl aminopeptidase/acylaminoacyl peptidase